MVLQKPWILQNFQQLKFQASHSLIFFVVIYASHSQDNSCKAQKVLKYQFCFINDL